MTVPDAEPLGEIVVVLATVEDPDGVKACVMVTYVGGV